MSYMVLSMEDPVVATHGPIVISQPHGLTLRLLPYDARWVRVEVVGVGLTASSRAQIDAAAFCEFFTSAATGRVPSQGKWYYKGDADENFVLQAAPDAEGRVLLTVDLLSTADDDTDWQVNGTILLPLEGLREVAEVVVRRFGRLS